MSQKKITIQDVAYRIKELYEALELTQAQFALKVGVTVTQVNRWCNSKAVPSPMAQVAILNLESEVFEDE